MLPTKDDVLDFINACKEKAVLSVVGEAKEYCSNLIDNTPVVKEKYQKFKAVTEFLDTLPIPEGFRKYEIAGFRSYSEPKLYRQLITYSAGEYDLLFRYIYSQPELFKKKQLDELNELLKKIIAVKDTYNGLAYTIKKIKKVDRMIGYLQELGYDTTHLCGFEMRALDKSLLFVCKDNKPDVKS